MMVSSDIGDLSVKDACTEVCWKVVGLHREP